MTSKLNTQTLRKMKGTVRMTESLPVPEPLKSLRIKEPSLLNRTGMGRTDLLSRKADQEKILLGSKPRDLASKVSH